MAKQNADDDIVDRLLKLAAYMDRYPEYVTGDPEELREAAVEIDKLRKALKQAGLYAWQGDTFKVMDIVRATLGEKE